MAKRIARRLPGWAIRFMLIAVSLNAGAESPSLDSPTPEASCLGLLGALPTKQIPAMKLYYDKSREPNWKEMAEKLHSLADSGDKDAQFTYSVLLLTGRCVPQDICAARDYRARSRGSSRNWEEMYPIPRDFEKQEAQAQCK